MNHSPRWRGLHLSSIDAHDLAIGKLWPWGVHYDLSDISRLTPHFLQLAQDLTLASCLVKGPWSKACNLASDFKILPFQLLVTTPRHARTSETARLLNEVGALFTNHDGWRVGVSACQHWHDR